MTEPRKDVGVQTDPETDAKVDNAGDNMTAFNGVAKSGSTYVQSKVCVKIGIEGIGHLQFQTKGERFFRSYSDHWRDFDEPDF
jgi:hypothetical protein